MSDTDADRALLRRFEPVLRFTRGEQFFPMRVGPYVAESSLWRHDPGEPPRCLVPEGSLTLEALGEPRPASFGTVYYIQFIEPLNIVEMARYSLEEGERDKEPRNVFVAGRGRLARVGYSSRLVDALFTLTLLARGRVPGDTAAAAAQLYRRIMQQQDEDHVYYGRVVRDGDWTVLQYWFFYAYNNWRTGFFGVNDHEADWEQVSVYLYEDEDSGDMVPEWVAYASHDYSGDDLRRRWDDPELHKVGEHPVVYPGAGSHASYFAPGEYLAEVELPFLRPLARLAERFERARQRAIERYQGELTEEEAEGGGMFSLFRIPFVDYARGDGHSIGPGQDHEWEDPELLEPPPGWAAQYRGLWGLYARDPLSGEDAPAGPLYNRDGTTRKAWYDPLGWAGLDKVPPPSQALQKVYQRRADLLARRAERQETIEALRGEMLRLGVGAEAMRGFPHLKRVYEERTQRIVELSVEIDRARAELARDAALLEALEWHAERIQSGVRGSPRAHIKRAHHPIRGEELRLGRVAEFWAASSVGLMMVMMVGLAVFSPRYLWVGLVLLVGVYLAVEAALRHWLGRLITSATLVLAAIAAILLLVEFFWAAAIVVVLVLGGYILFENLRELRR